MDSPISGFVGNATAVRGLRAALGADRVAHAYLITGPAQVGKRTLASLFAAGIVCPHHTAHSGPCGACRVCRLTGKNALPDVRVIGPEAGSRQVKIEQVRQLERDAERRPYEGDRKAFILIGADAILPDAANALLKTLEEPPDDTTLILTASDLSGVLPTIVSRCREVPLRPVPAIEIQAALEVRGATPEHARLLARQAAGRPGWAIGALADPERVEALRQALDQLEALLAQSRVARLAAAAAYADSAAGREGARAILDHWLGWWRDALLVQQGCEDLVANVDRLESLRRLGATHPTARVWGAIARVQEARQQLDANANVRLVVEALLLDLPEHTAAAGARRAS